MMQISASSSTASLDTSDGLGDSSKAPQNSSCSHSTQSDVAKAPSQQTLCAELLWLENQMKSQKARKKEIEKQLRTLLQNQRKITFQNQDMEQKYGICSCDFVLRRQTRPVPLTIKDQQKHLATFFLNTSDRPDNSEEKTRANHMAMAATAYLSEQRIRKETDVIEKKFAKISQTGKRKAS